MTARRHKVIIGDGSAINLQIENYVPSEVRDPDNDQTPTRLSGGAPVRDYANETGIRESVLAEVYLNFTA